MICYLYTKIKAARIKLATTAVPYVYVYVYVYTEWLKVMRRMGKGYLVFLYIYICRL